MTTIPPTAAALLQAAAAATTGGPVVAIPEPPPQLLQLPAGTTVEAIVIRTEQLAVAQAQDAKTADVKVADTKAAEAKAAADTRALVILRTSAGDIAVRTAVPLDDGARVALEIVRQAPAQTTARMVSIDDVPVQQALARNARDTQAQAQALAAEKIAAEAPTTRPVVVQPGQAWTPSGPVALTALQPLSAYVLKAPTLPSGAPLATSIANFLPGSDLGIRIVGLQLAGPTSPALLNPLPAPQTVLPVAGAPTTPISQPTQNQIPGTTAPATGLTQPSPGTTPIAPGTAPLAGPTVQTPASAAPTVAGVQTSAPAQVVQATPSAQTPQAALPGQAAPVAAAQVSILTTETPGLKLPNPQGLGPHTPTPPQSVEITAPVMRLTGQVTGTATNGAVVVQTSAGEIQLNIRANVPPGSSVTFEVLTTQAPRADAPTLPAPPSPTPPTLPLITPTTGWSSLSEAMQLLQRLDPQAAAQLTAAIPDGGPRTAVASMAFVQAMRSGDARQWPGDTALRALERASPRGAQLASQISGEVREMAARAADAGGEWRTLPMPWNADGKIERVNLITRREGADDEDDEKKKKSGKGKGTRFLINLDLSRLGEMQLDGMFVKTTRAFDMMVRTKDPLPDDMRRDLAGLFANSNAAMGLKGALSF